MPRKRTRKKPRVFQTGAPAGSVLCGASLTNRGLRLQIREPQPPGNAGAVAGRFIILDAGIGVHTDVLLPFIGRETDAVELLAAIRSRRPGSVHVASTRRLALEAGSVSQGPPPHPAPPLSHVATAGCPRGELRRRLERFGAGHGTLAGFRQWFIAFRSAQPADRVTEEAPLADEVEWLLDEFGRGRVSEAVLRTDCACLVAESSGVSVP